MKRPPVHKLQLSFRFDAMLEASGNKLGGLRQPVVSIESVRFERGRRTLIRQLEQSGLIKPKQD